MAYAYYDEEGNEIPESEVVANQYEVVDAPPQREYSGWMDVLPSAAKSAYGGLVNSAGGGIRAIEDAARELSTRYLFDTKNDANPAVKLGAGVLENLFRKSPEYEELGVGEDINEYASGVLRDVAQKYNFEPNSGSSVANRFATNAISAAPAIALGALTGGASLVPSIALQSFGSNYGSAREEGQDPSVAAMRGVGNAALDSSVAKLNFGKWFKPELSPIRRYGESVLSNVVTSPFQTVGNDLINQYTGGEARDYEDLAVMENIGADALMGLFGPYVAGKATRAVNSRADAARAAEAEAIQARIDEIAAEQEAQTQQALQRVDEIAAPKTAEDEAASAVIEEAARSAPQFRTVPELPKAEPTEGIEVVSSGARTPEFEAELLAARTPETSPIVAPDGRPARPTLSEILLPYTQKGTLRQNLEETEKAAVNEIKQLEKEARLAESRRAEAEKKLLPVVRQQSTIKAEDSSKIVDMQTFPKLMEQVGKQIPDKGAMYGWLRQLEEEAVAPLGRKWGVDESPRSIKSDLDIAESQNILSDIESDRAKRANIRSFEETLPSGRAESFGIDTNKERLKRTFDPTKRDPQRGAALFGWRNKDSEPPLTAKETVDTVIKNIDDKEIQRVLSKVNNELDTVIIKIKQPKIEKMLGVPVIGGAAKGLGLPSQFVKAAPEAGQKMIKAAENQRDRVFSVTNDIAEMAKPFLSLPASERMWEAALGARIQGEKFAWTRENFERIGLAPDEVEGLMSLRAAMDASLEIKYEDFVAEGMKPEEARAAVDRLKKANYVPFNRFGDSFVEVRDAATNKQLLYKHFRTESQKREILQQLKNQKGLLITTGKVAETPESLYAGIDSAGFKNHMKRSFDVAGYDKNLKRSVAEYITSLAYSSARTRAKIEFDDALKSLPPNMPEVGRYFQEYAKYQLSNEGESAGLRKAITAMTLAGRVSSAALNLTQQLTTTLPVLVRETDSIPKASAEWGRAQVMLGQRLKNPEAFAQKNPELSAFIEDAIRRGSITESQFRELTGVARGESSTSFSNALDLSMKFFDTAEKWNRFHSFIAAYNVGKQKGLSGEALKNYSESFVKETQFVYDKTNTPKWFRGKLGAPIGMYKKFMLSDLALFADLTSGSFQGTNKSANAKALATKIGMMVALGGLSNAAPSLREIEKILRALGVDAKQELREAFKDNEFLSDFLTNGLVYALGLPDISGAVGGEFIDIPDQVGQDSLSLAVGKTVGGVPVGIAEKLVKSASLASEGKLMKAAQQPIAGLSGPLKALDTILNDGTITDNAGREMVKDASAGELFGMALGFNPARNRKAQDKMRSAWLFKNNVAEARDINKRIAEAIIKGEDFKGIIAEHNRKMRETPSEYRMKIDPNAVKKIVQSKKDPLNSLIQSLPKGAREEARKKFGSSLAE